MVWSPAPPSYCAVVTIRKWTGSEWMVVKNELCFLTRKMLVDEDAAALAEGGQFCDNIKTQNERAKKSGERFIYKLRLAKIIAEE